VQRLRVEGLKLPPRHGSATKEGDLIDGFFHISE